MPQWPSTSVAIYITVLPMIGSSSRVNRSKHAEIQKATRSASLRRQDHPLHSRSRIAETRATMAMAPNPNTRDAAASNQRIRRSTVSRWDGTLDRHDQRGLRLLIGTALVMGSPLLPKGQRPRRRRVRLFRSSPDYGAGPFLSCEAPKVRSRPPSFR